MTRSARSGESGAALRDRTPNEVNGRFVRRHEPCDITVTPSLLRQLLQVERKSPTASALGGCTCHRGRQRKKGHLVVKAGLNQVTIVAALALATAAIGGCGSAGRESASLQDASAATPAPTPAPAPALALAPPPPPPTTYSAAISWSPPLLNTDGTLLTDLFGYRVAYGRGPTSHIQVVTAGTNASVATFSGLAPRAYYFSVTTLNAGGVASAGLSVMSKALP